MMGWMVFVDGAMVTAAYKSERDALEVAKGYARQGRQASVYKLVETHYFAADFHKKANI